MGSAKIRIALAGAILSVLGVTAVVASESGGETRQAGALPVTTAVNGSSATSADQTVTPAGQPATTTAANAAPKTTTTVTSKAGATTGSKTTATTVAAIPTLSPNASPAEVQKAFTAMFDQLEKSAVDSTGRPKPVTAAEVEAQLREQLGLIGLKP